MRAAIFYSHVEKSPPHIEFYLGYSGKASPARSTWEGLLRKLGCISQADCTEERCRLAFERGRREYVRRMGTGEEQLKLKRLEEIGEE